MIRALVLSCVCLPAIAAAQGSFVNWESPHVHPLDLSPDGTLLAACNTPDNRVLLFDVSSGTPAEVAAIPVGLDPVTARFRDGNELWVVNHISDSISIVDVPTGRVRATLQTRDEPADVVFTANPEQAFVSCSQANTIQVFDPANLDAAPTNISIEAEDPRALAYDPIADRVYAAIFESGNGTTILAGGLLNPPPELPNVVSDPAGPYGGNNPPPNAGAGFEPPRRIGSPTPPEVGLIVRQTADGRWLDDNEGDWTDLVSGANAAASGRIPGWTVVDRDVAIIDPSDLSVTYAERLMTICMGVAVDPATGEVSVIGAEATNEIRFEPNLESVFVRSHWALFDPENKLTSQVFDLNPHLLPYTTRSVSQNTREMAVGDPRGIAWNSTGTEAYVSGMGSNNVVVMSAEGTRLGRIDIGEGPTGISLSADDATLFALNRFDSSISVIDVASRTETGRVPFFDPTPAVIAAGRKHLYDTHLHSGLGQVSCASCHVDARMDRLAWDLGDPSGSVKSASGQNLGFGIDFGDFESFHPMKGPMATQTLQDIIGKEPFHWRGDRDGIEEFGGAFVTLLGGDEALTGAEMQAFEDYLATIHFPPNPFRNMDNSLPNDLPLPNHFRTGRFGAAGDPLPNGNAVRGLDLYRGGVRTLDGAVNCVTCHTLPSGMGPDAVFNGTDFDPFPVGPMGEHHLGLNSADGSTNRTMKVAHLRNVYEKAGMELQKPESQTGFGFLHDGSVDSISSFIAARVFDVRNDQEVADLVALMLSFAGGDFGPPPEGALGEPPGVENRDTHAAVGRQETVRGDTLKQASRIPLMLTLADAMEVDVVVKGVVAADVRGWVYQGSNLFQADLPGELLSLNELLALAGAGAELTFTVVPFGSGTRIGIDRDEDGHLDTEEIQAGSDPADPESMPGEMEGAGEGMGEDEGMPEEGMGEGEGEPEGMPEEGIGEGEGEPEEGMGEMEGMSEEGAGEGEGEMEGAPDAEPEGMPEEGMGEGEGEPEEGAGEPEGQGDGPFLLQIAMPSDEGGSIELSPDLDAYDAGTVVSASAIAEPGWEFLRWTGDLFGTRNPTSFEMFGDKTIGAFFVPESTRGEGVGEGLGEGTGEREGMAEPEGSAEMEGLSDEGDGEGASDVEGEGEADGMDDQEGSPDDEGEESPNPGNVDCRGTQGRGSSEIADAFIVLFAMAWLATCGRIGCQRQRPRVATK